MKMIMLIGLIGKPSSGKTTLFNAICLSDAKMGNYPFTTINPNKGVGFVKIRCPCQNLPQDCSPKFGSCTNGIRFVPVDILDVAGLVPGASEGKGMGNKFLDDLRRADILIHVVDVSGTTDAEGNETKNYDPSLDIQWLDMEIFSWIFRLVFDDWDRFSKKLDADRSKLSTLINEKLSGLGSNISVISKILREENLADITPREWNEESKSNFVRRFKDNIFPMIIAANKIDRSTSIANLTKLKQSTNQQIISTSGLSELFLRRAAKEGLIDYILGSSDFTIMDAQNDSNLLKTVKTIKDKLFKTESSTGVSKLINTAVFDILDYIPVFTVEDQNKLTDKDGRVLPDVYLVKNGTQAKEVAGLIHTDLRTGFLHGILANDSNKRISSTYEVQSGDILKIVSSK